MRASAQDLTRDVVRIDAIPSTSLDTIRVRPGTLLLLCCLPWHCACAGHSVLWLCRLVNASTVM